MKNKQNIKRVISQKIILHDKPDGERDSFVDIFSAVKRNNRKTKMIRHMRKNQNKSTILVKSNNSYKYKVISANKNKKVKKYSVSNPENIKKFSENKEKNL